MTQVPSHSPDTSAVGSGGDRPRLWTQSLMLLCTVTVLCYCSHQLVSGVLSLFVQSLGGSPVIAGLIFTSFSVTSFILRPRIELFIAAGFLNAIGHSLVHPALTAFAMDRAAPGRMGKAIPRPTSA